MFYCMDDIEDEVHVITKCPLYSESREVLYENARRFNADFDVLSDKEKFVFMFECAEICGIVAKTCYSILFRRNSFFYIDNDVVSSFTTVSIIFLLLCLHICKVS